MRLTPGPYIWLQDNEQVGRAECGCYIDGDAFYQCALHAAAPAMLALLKSVPPINGGNAQTEMEWNWKLEALLAKIEGKD